MQNYATSGDLPVLRTAAASDPDDAAAPGDGAVARGHSTRAAASATPAAFAPAFGGTRLGEAGATVLAVGHSD